MKILPDRLQSARLERGLTRSQVAQRIGVSRPTFWSWETGKGQPRSHNLAAVAQVLDVPIDFFTQTESQASPDDLGDAGSGLLVSYIGQARSTVAKLAGVEVEKVKIVVEF